MSENFCFQLKGKFVLVPLSVFHQGLPQVDQSWPRDFEAEDVLFYLEAGPSLIDLHFNIFCSLYPCLFPFLINRLNSIYSFFRGGESVPRYHKSFAAFTEAISLSIYFANHHNIIQSLLRNNPVSGAPRAREINSGVGSVQTEVRRHASSTHYHDVIRVSFRYVYTCQLHRKR